MRRLCITLCLIASLLLLASCSSETIVGSWQHDSQNVIYTFNEDLTYTIDIAQGQATRQGTYVIEDGKMLLMTSSDGLSQTGEFKLEDKQLIISSPDSGSVTTMTRIKTQ